MNDEQDISDHIIHGQEPFFAQEEITPLWKRLPNEPAKWFSRFEIYLSLGPERSVRLAYKKVREARSGPLANNWNAPTGAVATWSLASRTWDWAQRADAWDEENRQILARQHAQRRIDEREARIQIITEQLQLARAALLACQMGELGVDEARRLLPTIRLLLRDMLEQQRIDLEPLLDVAVDEPMLTAFSADALAAATRELANSSWGLALADAADEPDSGPINRMLKGIQRIPKPKSDAPAQQAELLPESTTE